MDTRLQGHLDIGLNEMGLWQVGRVAQALADEPMDAIYASDLLRAWQTAQAIARVAGCPLTADPGLRERGFGSFDGKTHAYPYLRSHPLTTERLAGMQSRGHRTPR